MNYQTTGNDHDFEELTYQREIEKIQKNNDNKMLRNSTPKYVNSSNSTQQTLLFNTSSVNADNLQECLSISKEIERQEQSQQLHRRFSHPTPLQATMTHEEIYDCSFEDDRFLTALEYQNSLGTRQITDLDASQCFADAMKYFDEDVNVDSGVSRCDTPTKLPAKGTVAAAVTNFKTQLSKSMGSPPPPYKEHASPKTPKGHVDKEKNKSIQELRKKYEQAAIQQQPKKEEEKKSKEKEQKSADICQSAPAALPVPKQKRPKSKVKQMAHMFNSKIAQLMRRDSTSKKNYTQLENSQTSNTKSTTKPIVLKPAIKQRSRLPIYRTGLPSPVPSPRFKRRHQKNAIAAASQSSSDSEGACLIAEDVFRKLSVKDKALLYNKFIEDMTKQHPQFDVHARFVEAHVQQELERSERAEKSPKVKEMARELESRFNLNTPQISPWAMKRLAELQKMPEYEAAIKLVSPMPQSAIGSAVLLMQENESAANKENDQSDKELDDEKSHVSTLTVVLKSALADLPTKQRAVPRILPRKEREQRFINDMRMIEHSQKRNNDSMRSSISFDASGPPKKIRRTRAERLQPKAIFQNAYMERMFYNWIMEKNGVTFDITTVENSEDSLCANGDEVNTSKGSVKSKSRVHTLLEKAMAKFESVEARVMKRDSAVKKSENAMKIISEICEPHTAEKSVTTLGDEVTRAPPSNRPQRRIKRQAPLPPTTAPKPIKPEQTTQQQERLSTSSSKQSEAESESGLSSLPKPPENELQKSHDHNPAALSEHQLRVQASLQRLNIPDWFRQYNQNTSRSPDGNTTVYKPGNFTRKRTTESGRWAGLNSKTTSLSSLGSQRSDRSPLLLSPSAHSHHGGQVAQQHGAVTGTSVYGTTAGAGAFSRWSTSHLNSSQTSPSVSQRGSFTRGAPINSSFISVASGQNSVIRSSYRQPYLGWRSQEKLSQRTPHERLASSLLAQQQQRTTSTQRSTNVAANGDNGKLQPVTPEIQSSIKEVTSAIVHYVNDQTQQQQQQSQRSRSASPNSRKCWLESSFVGIRPLDSPQTPVIENTATAFSSATNTNNTTANNSISSQYSSYNYNYNYNTSNSSTNTLTAITTPNSFGGIGITTAITTNPHVLRMNGLSIVGGAPERSLSNASLEDVLASLLGLPSSSAYSGGVQSVNVGAGARVSTGASVGVNVNAEPSATSDPYTRSTTTTGDSANHSLGTFRHMPQQQQQPQNPQSLTQLQQSQQQLLVELQAEQQRLRRRSEGDAPQQQKQQQQQQQLQNRNAKTNASIGNTSISTTHANNKAADNYQDNNNTSTISGSGPGGGSCIISTGNATIPTRRVSLGDSSESNNKTTSELQIKCRNTKCDRSATPADAKKYYKSCHNCTHLYCTRECRRAHWEKHRKACLHSRASNLCRQVLATCKDDVDSQRHLSLLARKGFLSQGRGVVRVLFRSAEAAESFIKHGFQCMGEASYVRWPDLMPAEMGLELYSELLKLSTEYKPDSKMLIYVAICVVSEAPGMGQAPVRWERQLVSRCAKLKLCKSILAELEQQQQALQQQQQQQSQQSQLPLTVVAVPETTTEILILTFNPNLRSNTNHGELILSNILDILSRRGVLLRKHYPEIYQRLQTYTDGQTEKFNPVTLHPRDSQTGKSFVCIIMPVHSTESGVIKLPSVSDGGNRVTTIDVGSPAALAELDDDELLTRSAS